MFPEDGPLLGRMLLAAIFLLIVLARIVSVADGADPGIDQAALMANFPLESWADLFRPLPFFEQATSLGSAIELDLISRLFGTEGLDRFHAARVIAALSACLAYYLLCRTLKPDFAPVEIALILALLASPREILLFTTNVKHYVFELLCACILARAALAYLERPGSREIALFLGLTLFTAVMAISAPLIVVTIGSGMLAATIAGKSRAKNTSLGRDLFRLCLLGFAAIAICVAFYALHTRAVSIYQTEAYAYEYTSGFLSLGTPFSQANLAAVQSGFNVFHQMIEPAYTVEVLVRLGLIGYRDELAYLAAIIAVVGYLEYWRRSAFLAGALTGGMVSFLALNIAGFLPFVSTRHFMFFAPFAVPCFALGLIGMARGLFGALGIPKIAEAVLGGLAIGVSAAALSLSDDLERLEVTDHFDRIEAYPAPVWIYYGAQPSARSMRPDLLARIEPPVLGLIPHDSSKRPWGLGARTSTDIPTMSEAFMARTREELSGTEPVWVLFANHWPERRSPEGLQPVFDAAEAHGRLCRTIGDINSVLAFCAHPDDFPEGVLSDVR